MSASFSVSLNVTASGFSRGGVITGKPFRGMFSYQGLSYGPSSLNILVEGRFGNAHYLADLIHAVILIFVKLDGQFPLLRI